MAVNEIPKTPEEKRYGMAAQATWGTAIADNAAFIQLDCEPVEVEHDVKRVDIPIATGDRTPRESSVLMHTKGSHPALTVPNLLVKDNDIDHLLYSYFGQVTEGATTPYDKTFTFPATQPNYASDAGHFLTLIERMPTASQSKKVTDAIVKELTFALEKGGLLMVNATMQGRGAVTQDSNPSGTWTRAAVDSSVFHYEDLDRCTIDFGGGAKSFHLDNFSLTLAKELAPIGQDGSGNSQYPVETGRKVEGSIKVVVDGTDFNTAYTNWTGDTEVDINIGWGNATPGTDDRDLDFTIHGKITEIVKDHSGAITGEIKFVGLENDDGSTDEAITVVMANAVDRSW